MLQIIVNGKEITNFSDVNISLEYNNNMFSNGDFDGNVCYSFDIPIRGNELIYETLHDIHFNKTKKYTCTILFHGVPVVQGSMIVQRIEQKRATVCVIESIFDDDFLNDSITELPTNEVTISLNSTEHKAAFLRFLKESTNANSVFKFAPFINENGYGGTNEDFGFWNGVSVSKMVNRLFFSEGGDIINANKPLIRIFPETNYLEKEEKTVAEYNQFCFCPQIKLRYILECIANRAGYNICGGILNNEDFNRLFVQSGIALDAPSSQFEESTEHFAQLTANMYYEWRLLSANDENNSHLAQQNGTIRFPNGGFYEIHYKANFQNINVFSGDKIYFYIGIGVNNPCFEIYIGAASNTDDELCFDGNVFVPSTFSGVDLYVGAIIKNEENPTWQPRKANGAGSIISILSLTSDDSWLNIFKKSFVPSELFPNVSNADFLKSVCRSFGVAFFINPATKHLELTPCEEVINAQTLDLSEYVLPNETKEEVCEKNISEFAFSQVEEGEDMNNAKNHIIGSVSSFNDLPNVYKNIGNIFFVEDLNAFFVPEKIEDELMNYRLEWTRHAGNNTTLTIGNEGKNNSTKSEVKIPSIVSFAKDFNTFERKLCPSIPFNISSYISNYEGGLSDIVALYYRGTNKYVDRNVPTTICYEDMIPVRAGQTSLTTTGDKSWGDKYLAQWQKLLHHSNTLQYRFLMTNNKFIELLQLFRPQPHGSQTRNIMVNNVKSLPIKIKVNLSNDDGLLFVEVEAAKY